MSTTVIMIISAVLYVVIAPFLGGFLGGLDRKISARMQGRVGPSVLQPFYDVGKLLEKESITVNRFQDFYVACFLIFIIITGALFFAGLDLLLVIFTLTLASMFLVVASYSSNSPYAQVGAERELLQMMAYEPMVLFTAIGFYLVCGSFSVMDIIQYDGLPAVAVMPLIFVGFLYILTIKFRKSPFDLSMSHHAHQELVKGMSVEFSGRTLAAMEVAHWYENVFLLGMVFLFFINGTLLSVIIGVVVCLLTYFLEVLIDNCAARMKWQFALRSSWLVALVLGFVNLMVLYYL